MQPIDSINNNAICKFSVTLGHANKDNIVAEYTCVDEMSKREYPEHALKIHSKTHGACFFIVLQCAFVSVDHLEKQACTFFAGGNVDCGGYSQLEL